MLWTRDWKPTFPEPAELETTLPIIKPDPQALLNPPSDKIQIMWIGHATVLVQIDGMNILTDPIFSDRCSPMPPFGPKRYRPTPLSLRELPRIDIVLLSHTHYDHMDRPTILELGNHPRWFVPMGVKQWFLNEGITNVEELTWWDEKEVKIGETSFKIACTPCQHWCKRTLLDDNKSLWSSWLYIGKEK